MTDNPQSAPPSLDDILRWLSAEAEYWIGCVRGEVPTVRHHQTNLIGRRLSEWRDTGKEPNHGLE